MQQPARPMACMQSRCGETAARAGAHCVSHSAVQYRAVAPSGPRLPLGHRRLTGGYASTTLVPEPALRGGSWYCRLLCHVHVSRCIHAVHAECNSQERQHRHNTSAPWRPTNRRWPTRHPPQPPTPRSPWLCHRKLWRVSIMPDSYVLLAPVYPTLGIQSIPSALSKRLHSS
jgi:hypothetical protein